MLSFGEEAEEEEKELVAVKQKIKSSHDVLDDPRLLKDNELVKIHYLFFRSWIQSELTCYGVFSYLKFSFVFRITKKKKREKKNHHVSVKADCIEAPALA